MLSSRVYGGKWTWGISAELKKRECGAETMKMTVRLGIYESQPFS